MASEHKTLDTAQVTWQSWIDPRYNLSSAEGAELSGQVPLVQFELLLQELPSNNQKGKVKLYTV